MVIDYIKRNSFDVVCGIGCLKTAFLCSIQNSIKCMCIGWMHSTFQSYFRVKGTESYGLSNYCRANFKRLDKLITLTKTDKILFDEDFKVDSYVLNNPLSFSSAGNFSNINGPIVFVGRLVKAHKGLDYLVDIISRIHKIDNNRKFIIVGDGPDSNWLKKRIIKEKLEDEVVFTGMVENVQRYIRNSSILVHTSRYEGFGVVILEAFACGIPVVAFHNNGPDEIIENGKNGYLIEKYDCSEFSSKITSLLNDIDSYEKMSTSAISSINKFSINTTSEKFIDICKR